MSRLKIGPRLTLAFIIVFLLMFTGSAIGIWQYNVMQIYGTRLQQVDLVLLKVLRIQNEILTLQDRLENNAGKQNKIAFSVTAWLIRETLMSDLVDAIGELQSVSGHRASGSNDVAFPNSVQSVTIQANLEILARMLPEQISELIVLAHTEDWVAVQVKLEDQILLIRNVTGELIVQIENLANAERTQALNDMKRAQNWAMIAIVGTGMMVLWVAGFLGYIVTRSIIQPLEILDRGAQALAAGDFSHRVEVTGYDELANLGYVFNNAAAQLAELYNNLEDLVRRRTDELNHRTLQLETSIAVGQSITSILDLNTLLAHVVELIRSQYGYYYVGIFLLDKRTNRLIARAGTGEVGKRLVDEKTCIEIRDDNLVGNVALTRHILSVNDTAHDDRYKYISPLLSGTLSNNETPLPYARAELAIPLEVGEELLGVLNIQSAQVGRFGADDLPGLQLLANEVAVAIYNASLYETEKSRRSLTETLYRIGLALSGTLDLSEVLNLILHYLLEIVPYDRGSVMLRSDDVLEIVAALGFPIKMNPLNLQVSIHEDDVYENICRTRKPLYLQDVSQRMDWQYVEGIPEAQVWLGVPLIRFGEVIGMLSLTREKVNLYTEDEIALASAFAGQAAIALQNARLYDRITRFNQQLEQSVQTSTEELQIAYQHLEHLDRTKADFIMIASYELRTPLTVLRCYSDLLLRDPLISSSLYHRQMMKGIEAGTLRLSEIVDNVLDIARIESQALRLYPGPVVVTDLIKCLHRRLEDALIDRKQVFIADNLDSIPSLEADKDALEKVFYNLLTNAIKFTPDGGTITVTGRHLTRGRGDLNEEGIEVIVQDTGIGVDPDSRELIFTKFYQPGEVVLYSTDKMAFKSGGTRLGLAIARGLIEAHGGKLWVESSGCDETTCPGSAFHVILPLRHPLSV
ncbi:MAG: GAF domain-containing protein [Anaerolineae bacterium]|nr:GAF domain-containing protein [Anaerolineae bacterium]